MFIQDRDLLVFEPNLFRDVVWVGQRLTVGVASIGDVILAIEGADVDFENSGVEAGCVVTVGEIRSMTS